MKIGRLLANVGTGLVSVLFPPAAPLVAGIANTFLPKEKQLDPKTMTGEQAREAIDSLPADVRSRILEKEIDLEITLEENWTERFTAMVNADSVGNTNRPKIVWACMEILAFQIISLSTAVFYSIVTGDDRMMKAIGDSWEWLLFFTGIPMWVIKVYFGKRTDEKKTRAAVATGQPLPTGLLGEIIGAIKGK